MLVAGTKVEKLTIQGSGGCRVHREVVTLASGTATLNHGMREVFHMSAIPTHASAAVDETMTWVGSLSTSSGRERTNGGQSTITSANGSSTAVVSVMVFGYGS